jgi:hypothetical protein
MEKTVVIYEKYSCCAIKLKPLCPKEAYCLLKSSKLTLSSNVNLQVDCKINYLTMTLLSGKMDYVNKFH